MEYIFGIHAVRVALKRRPEEVAQVNIARQRRDARVGTLTELAASKGVQVVEVSSESLAAFSHGGRHQGVVAQLHPHAPDSVSGFDALQSLVRTHQTEGTPTLLVLLDGVQDPHNLGACWRSSAAAGAHALIVTERRSAPANATAQKVASGASALLPCITVSNLARALSWLSSAGVAVIGASAASETSIFEVNLEGPVALVFGGESKGLRRLTAENCQTLAQIPMPGALESLNVSVAAGVLLFEAVRQRRMASCPTASRC